MMEMENGELENHRQLMKSVVEQVGLLRQATQASLILLKGPIFEILHNTQQPAARFIKDPAHASHEHRRQRRRQRERNLERHR